jgi:hypothetical protein
MVDTEAHERVQHKEHGYSIVVNGKERKVTSDILTYDEIVALAFNPIPPNKDFDIRFHDAAAPKTHGSLTQGETVKVKDGTKFDVTATNAS